MAWKDKGKEKQKRLRAGRGSSSRPFCVGEIEEGRADWALHTALYAICFLLPFSPANIRNRNV
ncbi:hypothetical protein C171_13410, partial [Paenibacillus sp. FSL H8-237]